MIRLVPSTHSLLAAVALAAFAVLILPQTADAAKKSPPEKIVFVTSTEHDGNFGGLSGADAICNARATEAGLPDAGNYLAWLSDSALSPADRFVRSFVDPYVLPDGTLVFFNWNSMTSGEIEAPFVQNELGEAIPSDQLVWTGTNFDGFGNDNDTGTCVSWTDSGSSDPAIVGEAGNSIKTAWTRASTSDCAVKLPIYCVQQ